MFELQICIGLSCVLIAAAAAIYYSINTTVPGAHHRMQMNNLSIERMQSHNRRIEQSNSNRSIVRPERNREIERPNSKPGDRCMICHEKIQIGTFEKLSCGHALHSFQCYDDWFGINSRCPHCDAEIQY